MSEKQDEYEADSPAIDPPNNVPDPDINRGEYEDGAIDPPNNEGGNEPPN
ncbi:MAG TPA: hypothetical protein VN643_16520 [Pyrinomonadaceae bacterium]|nr:hypothetical protein [Pyrinomonadaceae bacterium]